MTEDLHWADTSSRELAAFLLDHPQGSVLLVATYRSDEIHRDHPLRPLLAQAAGPGPRPTRRPIAPASRYLLRRPGVA